MFQGATQNLICKNKEGLCVVCTDDNPSPKTYKSRFECEIDSSGASSIAFHNGGSEVTPVSQSSQSQVKCACE